MLVNYPRPVRTSFTGLLVVVVLLLAACGGDDETTATEAAPPEPTTSVASGECADVEAPAPRDDGGATQPTERLDPEKTWTLRFRTSCGDFVVTLDPLTVRGATLRVVVECKDRTISGRAMRDEMEDARRNRDAAVGLVVFSSAHAPAGIAPFDVRMGDVYCVIDPEDPAPETLHAAVRLARLVALATVRDAGADIDTGAVRDALARITSELDAVRALKTRLATIGTAARTVSTGLDQLREGVVARIADAEAELCAGRGAPEAERR